jgi:hypothetical protein
MTSKNSFRVFASFLVLGLTVLAKSLSAGDAGFVQFFDDKDFKGTALTVKLGTDVPDMAKVATDDGKNGFNDRASSAKYQVPAGWQAVIYDDANFQKRIYVLMGNGEMRDLSKAADKCSSLRWESTGQAPAPSY